MHKILIDTCVWLDMAKDQEQVALLNVIEELIRLKELDLIVPRIVVDEFARNKEKIIKESNKSLSQVFKRVKDAVDKFGDPKKKQLALELLNDVDYKIPSLGEAATISITRIENLLKGAKIIETTEEVKLRAVQRAIENKAPFHRLKNSINDAIIIETYADCIMDESSSGYRFAFITHNKHDFSLSNGDERIPHPDLAVYFSKIKSKYFINLAEAVHRISPEMVTDIMIEDEWVEEPRSLSEIVEAEGEFFDKVWYNRYLNWLYRIEIGKDKIVDSVPEGKYVRNVTPRGIFEDARKAAKSVEEKYGKNDLGPWDDFEWGMLNGKLSALRWVLGNDWDFLDT